jgi:hypothetical protein
MRILTCTSLRIGTLHRAMRAYQTNGGELEAEVPVLSCSSLLLSAIVPGMTFPRALSRSLLVFSGFSTGVCDDAPMTPDELPPLLIGAGFESLSVASLIPFGSVKFGTCPMST